jgi:hypothetical protein
MKTCPSICLLASRPARTFITALGTTSFMSLSIPLRVGRMSLSFDSTKGQLNYWNWMLIISRSGSQARLGIRHLSSIHRHSRSCSTLIKTSPSILRIRTIYSHQFGYSKNHTPSETYHHSHTFEEIPICPRSVIDDLRHQSVNQDGSTSRHCDLPIHAMDVA